MTTEEALLMAKDIDISLTVKLVLMGFAIVYLSLMFYFSKLKDTDRYPVIIVKMFFMKIPSILFLIFLPLYSIFLLRALDVWVMWGVVASIYSMYMLIFVVVIVAFGMDTLLGVFGVDVGSYKNIKQAARRLRR